jgi:hypothetical protein
LFVAPDQEPLVGGLFNLHSYDVILLEKFLGSSLESFRSGRTPQGSKVSFAAKVFDILESLWLMQALKEGHFDSWYLKQQETRSIEEVKLQAMISSKLAGLSDRDPVRIRCKQEMQTFHDRYETQNCVLDAILNKTFYELLAIQEHALATIGFPYFTDRFTQHLLGAVGSDPYDKKVLDILKKQKVVIGAVLSLRLCSEDGLLSPLRYQQAPTPEVLGNRGPPPMISQFPVHEEGNQRARTKRRRSNSNDGVMQQMGPYNPMDIAPPMYQTSQMFHPAPGLAVAPSLSIAPSLAASVRPLPPAGRGVSAIKPAWMKNEMHGGGIPPRDTDFGRRDQMSSRSMPPAPPTTQANTISAGRGASAVKPAWMKNKLQGNDVPPRDTHFGSRDQMQSAPPSVSNQIAASVAAPPISQAGNGDRKSALLQQLAGMLQKKK